mmetsp:Transcript_122963/g.244664  ORF Transcript_122963/g.244664 Transcript_122963/m.244664 type:complete len:227 (+) Transcript_122963:46-726(+)
MFKQRAPPASRRRATGGEVEGSGEADTATADHVTVERLKEVRQIQREQWQKPRGVLPVPKVKDPDQSESDEEEDQWGLLDSSFAGASGAKGPDPHLEAYINQRLYERSTDQDTKEKTREERLYEIPQDLQVPDNQQGAADKMSWVAGLAEVPLGLEYKLANIEATEKAKREYLHGESAEKGYVLEPDSVTRKAFGSRFLHFGDRAGDSKSATDDAVLERFRKRMRR